MAVRKCQQTGQRIQTHGGIYMDRGNDGSDSELLIIGRSSRLTARYIKEVITLADD